MHDAEEQTPWEWWWHHNPSPFSALILPHREQHSQHRDLPLSAELSYRTASPQMNLVFTRLPFAKWWHWDWGMDIVHYDDASMKTLSSARPLSLTSLRHSDYKFQGICIWPDTSSDDTSQEFPLTSVPDISSALSHDVFPETRVLLFKLNPTCKLYSCLLHFCRYISVLPPAQAILANSKSMNFGKHPAGKSPVIQGRLLLLLIVLLSTTLQMLSRRSGLLGVWFEVPVPGGTFPRSCLGLWSDPSSSFLAEKKWTRFTENWSHRSLKNYSYFYCAEAKWIFLACASHNIWVIWLLWFCHPSLQRLLHLGKWTLHMR